LPCSSEFYKIIIVPVGLYGCETWSLIPRREHRLRVSDNRVLRRIFGPTREEATGGWRNLHNEELRTLSVKAVFWTSSIVYISIKFTTFRKLDLLLSSGKKEGQKT
jgi:hypothetical protein